MKLSTLWTVAAVVVFVATSGPAVAQAQDAAASVDKRQASMKRMGGDLKAISEYGKGQGDEQKALAAAQDIVETQKTLADLFPKGTGSDAFPGKSYANPKLWAEWDKFLGDNKLAQEKAGALLKTVQSGDKAAIAAAPGDIWDNGCQICHKSYREKKPS
ncbi:MAG TPA: cytochrome c [Stellaceae bacterium]|nr:cytochrome c [Stellaceae bacterium]